MTTYLTLTYLNNSTYLINLTYLILLVSRNIAYVLGNFIMNKTSDDIVSSPSDKKLMELGLVYGDTLPHRGIFSENNNNIILTYKERAVELEDKIR